MPQHCLSEIILFIFLFSFSEDCFDQSVCTDSTNQKLFQIYYNLLFQMNWTTILLVMASLCQGCWEEDQDHPQHHPGTPSMTTSVLRVNLLHPATRATRTRAACPAPTMTMLSTRDNREPTLELTTRDTDHGRLNNNNSNSNNNNNNMEQLQQLLV